MFVSNNSWNLFKKCINFRTPCTFWQGQNKLRNCSAEKLEYYRRENRQNYLGKLCLHNPFSKITNTYANMPNILFRSRISIVLYEYYPKTNLSNPSTQKQISPHGLAVPVTLQYLIVARRFMVEPLSLWSSDGLEVILAIKSVRYPASHDRPPIGDMRYGLMRGTKNVFLSNEEGWCKVPSSSATLWWRHMQMNCEQTTLMNYFPCWFSNKIVCTN